MTLAALLSSLPPCLFLFGCGAFVALLSSDWGPLVAGVFWVWRVGVVVFLPFVRACRWCVCVTGFSFVAIVVVLGLAFGLEGISFGFVQFLFCCFLLF